jgi:PhnB protein
MKLNAMPFEKTFWSPGFGMVVDRFGTPWMVNCEPAAT